ncbi:AAA family ATPase [Candidatus Marsarchaeota G2 archaeon ECH_B_SAG-G16]|uniref:AAA family ATPase n=5 Tax=Candidatus Marsarchaeota TaxID=1978152 RepID=A0A2R6AH68_9ARCH|nr:MAG: AAA family ATPase [Candidatus Marsarchaeota G1 archaeon OSP_D]PSN85688.1 MAG: AAA family ATPase [Candidatus Marsarchaeota G1 archaeon BE_D]PSN88391.1 MAG: AAA family ATPase [Candidatus Marsarchaeota G1 archaeon OSP_C]PSN95897.1 MAG: AAA family ATPase [Candidatus Marsarchaeota G1 archaeon OSP_B]PSO05106.1 MAG: AAA family ATPase [Candidatus Marsarchaeota G2 archaeon ECH_B_SAG-G16]
MTTLAASELEKVAIRYANEGVQADRAGARGRAIACYQQAIETLNTLINLYPNYELNKVYIQRIAMYQARIKALKGEVVEDTAPQLPSDGQSQAKAKYEELVVKEKPNVKWEEVIGLEDAKRAIKESIVYPTKRPDLFPLGWPRGILMFGPPGCGKTLLAAATASEIDATFINIDAAAIMSRWLGEAEKNVARVFAQARSTKGPVIIFIDEVDALFGTHSNEVGGEVRVRNQFLQEMDGLSEKGRSSLVYVIAATNKPWQLDAPFIRRFQKRILVPLPDFEARVKTFALYTRNLRLASDVSLEELARMTEWYSPSDIRDVCQSAQLIVVRELFESGAALKPDSKPREITMEDFKRVIQTRKPSVSPDMFKSYVIWYENFKAL